MVQATVFLIGHTKFSELIETNVLIAKKIFLILFYDSSLSMYVWVVLCQNV